MQKHRDYSHIQKWCALSDFLLTGSPEEIRMQLNRLQTQKIDDQLFEVGPKRRKGGSPRLFMFREEHRYFFITAAMEKSQGGVKEISTAKSRAKELRGQEPPRSQMEVRSRWSRRYRILWQEGDLEKLVLET